MTVLSWWSHLSGSCRLCVRSERERKRKTKRKEEKETRVEKRGDEREKNHEKKLTEEKIIIHRR